jgi:hypothetical protein
MKIEVSIGEIVDKLSILQIKKNNITDSTKLVNILNEFTYLEDIVFNELKIDKDDFLELYVINLKLWNIEDAIRVKEKNKEFDKKFVDLARSVYINNDQRAEVKKSINIKYKSSFIEEKSYEKY